MQQRTGNGSRAMESSGRLVVVSNRLPVSVSRDSAGGLRVSPSDGGLVTAMEPVLRRRGGLWLGWPGLVLRQGEDITGQLDSCAEVKGFSVQAVPLSKADVEGFYEGFSNQVVWPLFHDLFTNCNFDPRYWDAYRRVNKKFATVVADSLQPDDLVWVHDYHLMCLGAELRELGVANPIGFFNHIPFPTPDIFRRLPWRATILRNLCKFDLLGFQTIDDEEHFEACIDELDELDLDERQHPAAPQDSACAEESSRPRLGSFPISIDYDAFRDTARDPSVAEIANKLKSDLGDRTVILGVDRLDYSKGLPNKFSAFRYALEQYPELRERVTLVQYVVPSREKVPEYHSLRRKLEGMVGAINGDLSTPGWIPIHYYFDSLARELLCAYYRMAEVCMVTSLKDGMNLISKEYCAAQVEEPGVLILSEFAGSAGELGDHALLVNPYNVEESANAVYRACLMPAPERARRMRELQAHVRHNNVYRWVDDFVGTLRAQARAPATAGRHRVLPENPGRLDDCPDRSLVLRAPR